MAQSTSDPTQVQELRHLLRVDLSAGTVTTEEVPQSYRDRFISGKGLGAALLLDELDPGVDPLSPENALFFMFGPLTSHAPGTSRYAAITKSPHTGAFVDSYAGGHFPSVFRFARPSYLGVVFEGKSDHPVYLDVSGDAVSIEDASDLWGLSTKETSLHFDGKHTKTAAIGPAGEKLVTYATITSDEGTHHAGRGGVGAVMGSKNLKAVVATGEPSNVPELQDLRIEHTTRLGTSEEVAWAREGGTQNVVDWTQEVGAIPSHNWTRGRIDDVNDLNIDAFSVGYVDKDACYSCPVACGHVVDFSGTDVDGAFPDASVAWGPEYETIGMMGANTDITDVTGVTELAHHADMLGMDTISLGNVISWTMEMAERGLIDYDIEWGDAHEAVELVEKIAARDDIGDALAGGVSTAAATLCPDEDVAREAAVDVKGLELPAYEPRASFGMALAFATSDRGACHQRAWPIGGDALGGDRDPYGVEGMAEAVIEDQDANAVSFSMVACDFTAYDHDRIAEWLNALGYDVTVDDLEVVGERSWNMTRLFNLREGFTRENDELPQRLTRPLENGGPADGNALNQDLLDEMLDEYYERRGWDSDGTPRDETVERLDITDFAA